MNKSIIPIFLTFTLVLQGCAGRPAHLTTTRHIGDKVLTCEDIEHEQINIEQRIKRLIPEADKTAKNVALGIAGAFILIPWFFMDLSSAEKQEIQAFRDRYDYLGSLSRKKKCSL